MNYRVFLKETPGSGWIDTGIVEVNFNKANDAWKKIIAHGEYFEFKLVPMAADPFIVNRDYA